MGITTLVISENLNPYIESIKKQGFYLCFVSSVEELQEVSRRFIRIPTGKICVYDLGKIYGGYSLIARTVQQFRGEEFVVLSSVDNISDRGLSVYTRVFKTPKLFTGKSEDETGERAIKSIQANPARYSLYKAVQKSKLPCKPKLYNLILGD